MPSSRFIALLAMAWIPVAAAQSPRMHTPDGGLFEGITLTAQQRHGVDSIWAAHGVVCDSLHASRQAGQGRDAGRMEQHAAMHEGLRTAYRSLLTPAQQTRFDENATRLHPGPRDGHGAAGDGRRPAMGAHQGMGTGHPGMGAGQPGTDTLSGMGAGQPGMGTGCPAMGAGGPATDSLRGMGGGHHGMGTASP